MRKIKKITAIMTAVVLSASMMLSLTGCGKTEGSNSSTPAATEAPANDGGSGETNNTTGDDTDDGQTGENMQTPAKGFVGGEVADNSVDFAANLKLGWNLGNTLDAIGGSGLSSETSWGQPETTKELIDYVAASGFTTIRIPVSWSNHLDKDGKIDEAWMTRVTEIVDWSLDAGLFVILNSHHDNDAYYPTDDNYEDALAYIENVWTQIAFNFSNYDEHLIFESMNEPRLAGTNKEWWFNPSDKEGVAAIKNVCKLNQAFVNLVREAGGYNETRYLMVPSICASPDNALNDSFMAAGDDINRVIIEVHAYTPYDFAMNEAGYTDWDDSKINGLDFMGKLKKKFVDKGIGVVIDEFGATNKDNLEARVAWAEDFTGLAKENSMACVLWDNGGTNVGTENFGMIDRNNLEIFYPEILETMVKTFEE